MIQENDNKGWNFDNSYLHLPSKFYSKIKPTPVSAPEFVIFNEILAKELGITDQNVEIFVGNQIPLGAEPIAQAYAGHQYGYFTMLGDGRAVLLGEQITPTGERYDIVLKGSGRTPYSRRGDGRAVLGPMLREYIISEAMFALGIPTTRSLAVVTTGETVYREDAEIGAILTRVASSHIRVGTFEYIAQFGTLEELKALADYTISRHNKEIDLNDENCYLNFLNEVIKRQAKLISKWQLIGFVHGVMNTDNMTISGETIDYGPCAFIDTYNKDTVFSSIDRYGRYAYGNQPDIAAWNLAKFAETLLPLIDKNQKEAIKLAENAINDYFERFNQEMLQGMRLKLGLFNEESDDELLLKELLHLMEKYQADYTNTFRSLTLDTLEEQALFTTDDFKAWFEKWQERLKRQKKSHEEVKVLIKKHNPAIIPRNYYVEEALEAANNGDLSVMHKLLAELKEPYAYNLLQDALIPKNNCPYQTFCGT